MHQPGADRRAAQDGGQREQRQRQQAADAEQRERGQPADGGVGVEPGGGEHAELDGGAGRVAAGQAVVTVLPVSPAVTTANQPRVRSASRCKAKLHMNETSSAAIATAN